LLAYVGIFGGEHAVQTLYLLADLYWVGHLGKERLPAVGIVAGTS